MTRQLPSKIFFSLTFHTTTRSAAENAAPWNAKLQELSKQGKFEDGLTLYRRMLRSNASPNAFTFPFVLKSSATLSITLSGELLHCHVIKSGCESEPFVQTALISMYCKCGLVENASQVFDQNPQSRKLTVCYNALISGYITNSNFRKGCLLFREMRSNGVVFSAVTMLGLVSGCTAPMLLGVGMSFHSLNMKCGLETDLAIVNCLLTMYLRCGSIELARDLFDHTPRKGLITWNAMITGYAQHGLAELVLDLYCKMDLSGIRPDPVTLVAVLSSCANLGAKKIGFEVEKRIKSHGSMMFNIFLRNALINMYSRCGDLGRARAIFEDMPEKNIVTWTAMIGGYGVHGLGETAKELFDEMVKSGIRPDRTAFVSILSACSHAGLTKQGLKYLSMMETDFGLKPGAEHYSCIVDLLGRAGRVQEAYKLIGDMRVKPDGAVWGALLGACKIHKNRELAEVAFNGVIETEPMNIGYYVLLSNIYTEAKDWEGVRRVRVMMRERGLRKDAGYSYVEMEGRIHVFVAGDTSHPRLKEIHNVLGRLEERFGEDGRSKAPERLHSERLAIGFALLNTRVGADITVIKNLRICGDCHMFFRQVARVLEDRLFVVRDATRFHHFRNGSCSCNDYW
ncbi:unnamed protein product [Cuscuta epithymum]|uniref:DYW domain-containing protein n=1 Tax=Cuscuta epithymum TaxID=186058 RepID=A0AAV0DVF2_9ASTE|nr:unnamed protein product [Cuscuta epithymum]